MKNFLCILLCMLVVSVYADVPATQHKKIEQEVCSLLKAIDSKTRGAKLQDEEFVVAMYQQILGRNPNSLERAVASTLIGGDKCCPDDVQVHIVQIPRSRFIASLLGEKTKKFPLTYEAIQETLPLLRSLDTETVPFWQPNLPKWKSQENEVPAPQQKLSVKAHTEDYNVYHGYLHAHTGLSDGEGTPEQAYAQVRDVAKFDFFAVTDHAILLNAFPWENRWQEIKDTANKFHKDHEFVALYGFEWSSPILGHINVLGCDDLTDCVKTPSVADLCRWVADRPSAISRFNHPGRDPLGLEFDHFKLHAVGLKQMVAVEMFSKKKGIKTFLAGGYGSENHFLDEANINGWMLGTVGGQDNHDTDWGTRNDFNVGVWATELTREGILDAYRERRTYATEDKNLTMSFRMDGAEMGSRLAYNERNSELNIEIALEDGDRENFSLVEIYRKGVLVKSFNVKSSNPKVSFKVQTKSNEYYYVLVSQEDGDLALSSPIWIVE